LAYSINSLELDIPRRVNVLSVCPCTFQQVSAYGIQ
jgi:hypothetical protein